MWFVVVTALVLAASTGLLVLLDPRSQGWWGDRFSELGAVAHGLLGPLINR